MLQSDLNEKHKETDWQTLKGFVQKNGKDGKIDSTIEISDRFDS